MSTIKATPKTKSSASRNSGAMVVKIDHTFPDGTKFSGSFEQLQKVATALGLKITGVDRIPRGYYMSDSKGLVKISEMNDHHIRRALVKRSKEYFTEIYNREDTNREFIKKFTDLSSDSTVFDLFNELHKRK